MNFHFSKKAIHVNLLSVLLLDFRSLSLYFFLLLHLSKTREWKLKWTSSWRSDGKEPWRYREAIELRVSDYVIVFSFFSFLGSTIFISTATTIIIIITIIIYLFFPPRLKKFLFVQ